MSKETLVNRIVEAEGISRRDAVKAVDMVFGAVQASLVAGDDITIVGFGKFSVKDRPARTGRNPSTGETIQIAASKAPSFSAGKSLKDALKK
ncbi:MAG: HU family DNA-binding protein [Methyloprofundus sp.]|uniref:HU family DNA-binding protein n=1 Tax=Thiomicrospira sp. TaxID=935 RepID=UPI001A0F0507|nr:HU family DNA-binding protein [Methyloprofundus sp.]